MNQWVVNCFVVLLLGGTRPKSHTFAHPEKPLEQNIINVIIWAVMRIRPDYYPSLPPPPIPPPPPFIPYTLTGICYALKFFQKDITRFLY